jgi:hypothetical protein
MLEKHRQTVLSLQGEPFPAALNKSLPCRPPPDPLQSCLFLPSEPERNLNVSLSAASMARPSARTGKSRADTKAGAPRPYGIKEEGHCRLTAVTWRFKDSGYAYLPGSNRERDLRRLGVIG